MTAGHGLKGHEGRGEGPPPILLQQLLHHLPPTMRSPDNRMVACLVLSCTLADLQARPLAKVVPFVSGATCWHPSMSLRAPSHKPWCCTLPTIRTLLYADFYSRLSGGHLGRLRPRRLDNYSVRRSCHSPSISEVSKFRIIYRTLTF